MRCLLSRHMTRLAEVGRALLPVHCENIFICASALPSVLIKS